MAYYIKENGPINALENLQEIGRIQTEDRRPKVIPLVEPCELLRKNPHPNIATFTAVKRPTDEFLGYASNDITPHYWELVAFFSTVRKLVKENMNLSEILAAIKHLHKLGVVHNDINSGLSCFKRTFRSFLLILRAVNILGSHCESPKRKLPISGKDPSVEISVEKTDLDAFKYLQIWLDGSMNEDFFFE
ncbi:uncharacterized protein N7443_009844 [Penicillium atrosanguineum]|uniref:uncharacterized protein n=1 Tax=Penicillium atrosanguineum TaxID=1132637 RepID=UPI0023A2EBCA|nr:uncharacterized protein N7443_009844 [Penicillium atrosanguineum]KAJ5289591.1 hypothetical protein N7443_009844 [Penicillium atrosanguineum]